MADSNWSNVQLLTWSGFPNALVSSAGNITPVDRSQNTLLSIDNSSPSYVGTIGVVTGPFTGSTTTYPASVNSGYYFEPNSNIASASGDVATYEFWFRTGTSTSPVAGTITSISAADGTFDLRIDQLANGHIAVYTTGNNNPIIETSNVGWYSDATWRHFALVKGNGYLKLYVNGTLDGTYNSNVAWGPRINFAFYKTSATGTTINSSLRFALYDVRYTSGIARYTGNFTAPTTYFIAGSTDPVLTPSNTQPGGAVLDTGGGKYQLVLDRYDAQGTLVSSAILTQDYNGNTDEEVAVVNSGLHGRIATTTNAVFVGKVYDGVAILEGNACNYFGYAVIKLDTTSHALWMVALQDIPSSNLSYGSAGSLALVRSIDVFAAGSHVYVAATMPANLYSLPVTSHNTVVAKISSATGSIVWQRSLAPNSPTYDTLRAESIAAIADGNVYVAVTAQVSGTDMAGIVYKYNSSGTLQWQKIITTGDNAKCIGLAIDASENVYAAAVSGDTSTVHVVGIATGGTLTWQRNIVFTGQLVEAIGGITWDSTNSKIYVTVTVDSDHYISRLTSAGAVDWTRNIYRTTGGRDTAGRVKVDPANGVFLVAGSSV